MSFPGGGSQDKVCNCKKSNCLKLYCDCFAGGAYCNTARCNCHQCLNNFESEETRRSAILATLERNPNAFRSKIISQSDESFSHQKGCHCKRSNCLKKYCECFQGSIYCSDSCRCKSCLNFAGSQAQTTAASNRASLLATGAGIHSDVKDNLSESAGSTKSSFSYSSSSNGLSGSMSTSRSTLAEFESIFTAEGLGEVCRTLLTSTLSSIQATAQVGSTPKVAPPPTASQQQTKATLASDDDGITTATISSKRMRLEDECMASTEDRPENSLTTETSDEYSSSSSSSSSAVLALFGTSLLEMITNKLVSSGPGQISTSTSTSNNNIQHQLLGINVHRGIAFPQALATTAADNSNHNTNLKAAFPAFPRLNPASVAAAVPK